MNQKGQAISEFLVYMVWLIPFVFVFVAIVQMIKVQTQTHKAARYVAWERTVYSGEEYNDRLSNPLDGFDKEVKDRFFLRESSALNDDDVSVNRRFQDWKSRQSIVNLNDGVSLVPTNTGADNDTDGNVLDAQESQINWLSERTDVDRDSIAAATLRVEFDSEKTFALREDTVNPMVDSSYLLVADGWAPANEAMYSERVQSVRNQTYSRAQRWFQNTPTTRILAPIFDEFGEKMFVNGRDSFDMVSPDQSQAVPQALLEPYESGL